MVLRESTSTLSNLFRSDRFHSKSLQPLAPEKLMSRSRPFALFLILLLGITIRVGFNQETHLTFEDSLISFRYAENLADGLGFVYNEGERVLGTTSPLWTLLLALLRLAGFDNTIANGKVLGIVFDLLTIAVLTGTLRSRDNTRFALIWSALFASSSGIVPITISGMETPLLLFAMALSIRGLKKQSRLFAVGLATTILTRIDGLIFVLPFLVAAWLRDRRWGLREAVITGLMIAPWFVFSRLYFGTFLPLSIVAKTSVYDLGTFASATPFIDRFTPLGEATLPERFIKTVTIVLLTVGTWVTCRRIHHLRPLAAYFFLYCTLFAISGGMIFPWYLTPATFSHDIILATGTAILILKIGERAGAKVGTISLVAMLIVIVGMNITILRGRLDEYRQLQGIEDELRTEVGIWLKDTVQPGESVFLEPIGYIGYYAGPDVRIIDEIGIVSPPIISHRKTGEGWYIRAIQDLNPDYIVEYTRSMEENIAEGGSSPLFREEAERDWLFANYRIIKTFEAIGDYPLVEEKEKRYVILKGTK